MLQSIHQRCSREHRLLHGTKSKERLVRRCEELAKKINKKGFEKKKRKKFGSAREDCEDILEEKNADYAAALNPSE